jgi:hypothetical protein
MRLTEQDWNWVYADTAYRWTLQEFATVAGHSWYALQQQSDADVERQWTGYRYEMDRRAAQLGVTPEVLTPITEDEFLTRLLDQME